MNGSLARILAACLLLPLVYGLERVAYYGMRSVLFIDATQRRGLDAVEVSEIMRRFTYGTYAFAILGGLIAIAIGPRFTFALGAMIACAGFAVLPSDSVTLGVALLPIAIGTGILKPCIWAAAADAFPDPQESGRNALVVGLYVVINVAAFAGSSSAPKYGEQIGNFDGVFMAAALATALAGALALGLGLIHVLVGRGAPREEVPLRWQPLAGGALLLAVSLPYYLAMDLATNHAYTAGSREAAQLFVWNPAIVAATGIPLMLAMAALALMGKRAPTLILAGAGIALVALGAIPLIAAPGAGAALLAGIVVMGIGETFVGPLLGSRLAGGVHRRLSTLLAAFFLLGVAVTNAISSGIGEASADALQVFAGAAAVLALVTGMLLAALHFARRFLWPDPPLNPGPEAPAAEPLPGAFPAA